MKARRTPWWYYVLAVLAGALVGAGLAWADSASEIAMLGAPWVVIVLLLVLGIAVLVMALNVRAYVKGKRPYIEPQQAVTTLVLSKALGIAGAALAGWYLGQLIVCLPHRGIEYYDGVIVECVAAAVVCLVDMVIGIVCEGLCQLPPGDGPESPKVKERQRQAGLARRRDDSAAA